MCDLMWSDPEEIDGWGLSPRGAGYLFRGEVADMYNERNNLDLIVRVHQLVMEGHRSMFNDALVTAWSMPNYCYRYGTVASILKLDENLRRNFQVFDAAPNEAWGVPVKNPPPDYFLRKRKMGTTMSFGRICAEAWCITWDICGDGDAETMIVSRRVLQHTPWPSPYCRYGILARTKSRSGEGR